MVKNKTDKQELKPRITVVGVGGAGGNAVNNMISSNLEGVEFVVCNTDAQALTQSLAEVKIQLGLELTQGLGAGSKPDVGKGAAEESIEEISQHLKGTNMLFVTAGMGGGTGTGGAPVIAKLAREMGILTVGVVTKPFYFEGTHRMQTAEQGIEEMNQCVDTLLVIPNQNLFRIATEKTTFADAFAMADNILHSGVRTFTDLMAKHGLINLDFADISSVMREMMGKAMMGTGQATGDRRAIEAAEAAISCPLLDDVSMRGARAVLINVTGGLDMTLFEVDEAANRVREEVDPNANIIFGATFDETMSGQLRVSVVATGIDAQEIAEKASSAKEEEVASPSVLRSTLFSRKTADEDTPQEITPPTTSSQELQHSSTEEPDADADADADADEEELKKTNFEQQTWGRKHNEFFFDYAQNPSIATDLREAESPFQSMKTKEDDQNTLFSQKEQALVEPIQKPKKPLGFFERLTGISKRHMSDESKDFPGKAEPAADPSSTTKKTTTFEADSLDIPTFLRYQKGKK